MKIVIAQNKTILGAEAGSAAAEYIRQALQARGQANIILATGTSQFEILKHLTSEKEIDWSRVVMFHLDEYIGLPATAPASFRKYIRERFLDQVPPLLAAYLISGEGDPQAECERLGRLLRKHPIDLALVGIGENGHLAFNDPPADFDTNDPYIVVGLDEACRKQQWGEGWFQTLEEVPKQAISMSIRQILLSQAIICSVPDKRKAIAVKHCLQGPVSRDWPASILQTHPDCTCWLDPDSAGLL